MSTTEVVLVTTVVNFTVALLGAAIARKIGLLHFGAMEKAHQLNIAKATSKVGCAFKVEERKILGDGRAPHLVLHLTIYNEGDLASTSLMGHWRVHSSPTANLYADRPIQRDMLGKESPFQDEYLIQDSVNWSRSDNNFGVEVEFDYTSRPSNEEIPFRGKYSYEPQSGTLVRY
jgi:hypothetical protein